MRAGKLRRDTILGSVLFTFGMLGGCSAILGIEEGSLQETSPAGAGGATACDTCPGQDNECEKKTCEGGVCGSVLIEEGKALATQAIGDCQTEVCDGKGDTKLVADDDDGLDDHMECTVDECVGGEPKNTPASSGDPCSSDGGKVCDGAGHCVQCNGDQHCAEPEPKCDTANHVCVNAVCANMELDVGNGESDVDCGGTNCGKCPDDKKCKDPSDCQSQVCKGSPMTCQSACDDGVKNGMETGIDCGGPCKQKCVFPQGCMGDADCVGAQCSGSTCLANCADEVQNQNEKGIDCGGVCPQKCPDGVSCSSPSDCISDGCCGTCNHCCNGQIDPGETGPDCGGSCASKCPDGTPCTSYTECESNCCTNKCAPLNECAGAVTSTSSSSSSSTGTGTGSSSGSGSGSSSSTGPSFDGGVDGI